jgi:hypothetical protein
MRIRVIESLMSDGSTSYEVAMSDGPRSIVFPCMSEEDALSFCWGVSELVATHTVETVES